MGLGIREEDSKNEHAELVTIDAASVNVVYGLDLREVLRAPTATQTSLPTATQQRPTVQPTVAPVHVDDDVFESGGCTESDQWALQGFLTGFRAAGGASYLEDSFLFTICGWTEKCNNGESGGDHYAQNEFGHSGLTQFSRESWASVASVTGYWDVFDPWQHGYNTWVWYTMTESPYTQWSCFP